MNLVNAASRRHLTIPDAQEALHLGCGKNHLPGFTNVDFHDDSHADTLVDLREPWPWQTNSIDHIVAHHILEHLPDAVHFMDEAHRVLRANGTIHVAVPHYRHPNAWSDPTHVRAFTPSTMTAFTAAAPHQVGQPWHIIDQWVEGGIEPWLPRIIKKQFTKRNIQPRIRPGEIQWLMTPNKETRHDN